MKRFILILTMFFSVYGLAYGQPNYNKFYDYSRNYPSYGGITVQHYGTPYGSIRYKYYYSQNYNSYKLYPMPYPTRPQIIVKPYNSDFYFIW